ncbi:MAG: putative molybdenum carrier protein [Kofleriaceae bacterium]
MAITILHTGQSGVERGAARASAFTEFAVAGFCQYERRDEFGPLPPDMLANLTPCNRRGARSALAATLALADVVVIAVSDPKRTKFDAGIAALRRASRRRELPTHVIGPNENWDAICEQIRVAALDRDLKVLITGPRRTRWEAGERVGWRFVAQLSM